MGRLTRRALLTAAAPGALARPTRNEKTIRASRPGSLSWRKYYPDGDKSDSGNPYGPSLLPGVKLNTGPNDFAPIKQVQMARFDGERWKLFGSILTGAVG